MELDPDIPHGAMSTRSALRPYYWIVNGALMTQPLPALIVTRYSQLPCGELISPFHELDYHLAVDVETRKVSPAGRPSRTGESAHPPTAAPPVRPYRPPCRFARSPLSTRLGTACWE